MGNSDSGTRKYVFPENVGDEIRWHSWDRAGHERVRQSAYKYSDRRGWKFRCVFVEGYTEIRRVA
jgi:hypothetical protein